MAIKEITDNKIMSDDFAFDLITAKLESGQSSHERIGNVNVYRVGIGGSIDKIIFPILGTIRAFRLMSHNQYDLFWPMMVTYSSGVPYIVNMIRKMVGKKPIPIVLSLQEGDSEEHIRGKSFGIAGVVWRIILFPITIFLPSQFRRLGLIGVSWALALKRSAHVTAISNYLAKQAVAYGYTGKVSLVRNGVDIELFSRELSVAESSELKRTLGKNEGDIFLITTGRLVIKNAVDDIIKAMALLPANVKFISIGRGPLESELRELAKKLKVEDRVRFIDFVPQKDLPPYLQISDIFVRPSLSEGLGNSFLEAMAAGIPVIATQVGGIPDFLIDGQTGLFCEVKNPQSIAQKVEKLIKDRESRDYIIKNARKMVTEDYDWNNISAGMKESFREVLAG